jgi:hypothetical protein
MKKTYWNRQGKYQEWVDEISATMPDMYYTDNKYMNVFIAMSNIYYDIYNNGGCNIQDGCYKDALKYIHGFIGKFNSRTAIKDYDYLEDKANEVFEKLMEKDLSFENHGFWNNGRDSKVSMNEQSGECWTYITCGTKYNTEKEFECRKKYGFEEV